MLLLFKNYKFRATQDKLILLDANQMEFILFHLIFISISTKYVMQDNSLADHTIYSSSHLQVHPGQVISPSQGLTVCVCVVHHRHS